MKNVLMLLIIVFLSHCKKDNVTETPVVGDMAIATIQEGNLTIYNITKYNTIVVKIPEITSYVYRQKLKRTIAQIAADSNYSLIVNSSFFDYDVTSDSYVHAGYLKINNQVFSSMKRDRQITRLLAYDSRNRAVDYFDTSDVDKTKDYDLVVQTGPQIVHKSTICAAFIDSSINGNAATFRTAFGSVNGNELYIIVTRRGFTLKDLGSMLLRSGIFNGALDVIDFDGGPSTALYIQNHPELCFNSTRVLPLLLGVRQQPYAE